MDTEGRIATSMGDGEDAGESTAEIPPCAIGMGVALRGGETRGGVEQRTGERGMLRETGRHTVVLSPGARGLPPRKSTLSSGIDADRMLTPGDGDQAPLVSKSRFPPPSFKLSGQRLVCWTPLTACAGAKAP